MSEEIKKNAIWKLEADVRILLVNQNLKFSRYSSGGSPYSDFDLVAHPEGFRVGVDPATYTVSPVEIKSADPATAYKGRHAVGRLILAVPDDDGLVAVGSGTGDTVELTLADGTPLGRKAKFTLGDLFPDADMRQIVAECDEHIAERQSFGAGAFDALAGLKI